MPFGTHHNIWNRARALERAVRKITSKTDGTPNPDRRGFNRLSRTAQAVIVGTVGTLFARAVAGLFEAVNRPEVTAGRLSCPAPREGQPRRLPVGGSTHRFAVSRTYSSRSGEVGIVPRSPGMGPGARVLLIHSTVWAPPANAP